MSLYHREPSEGGDTTSGLWFLNGTVRPIRVPVVKLHADL